MGRAVSGCYPRWLGWVAVLAGILSTAVGFIQGLSANRRALSGLDDHWAHGHHAVAAVDEDHASAKGARDPDPSGRNGRPGRGVNGELILPEASRTSTG